MKKKEIIKNIAIITGVIILATVLIFLSQDDKKTISVDTSDIVLYKINYYLQDKDSQEYELLSSKTLNNYTETEITIIPDEFDNYEFNEELSTSPLTITLSKDEDICIDLYYRYIGE